MEWVLIICTISASKPVSSGTPVTMEMSLIQSRTDNYAEMKMDIPKPEVVITVQCKWLVVKFQVIYTKITRVYMGRKKSPLASLIVPCLLSSFGFAVAHSLCLPIVSLHRS